MIKKTITVLLFSGLFLGSISVQAGSEVEFDLPNLISKATAYHPSIKSNIFLEDSAKNEITSAKWQYFPTPKFSVSQVDSSSTNRNGGDSRVSVISLTQPLWAGGYIDAGLKKSRARLLSARATTKVAQQDLALRVIIAYSKWYDSYLKKESYKKSKKEYEALRARLRIRIKQGLSSSIDLNLVDSRSTQADASLDSAIIQYENSLLNLKELLGTPLDSKDLIRDFSIVKFENNQLKLRKRALLINPRIKQIKAEGLVIEAELNQSRAKLHPGINLKLERQWGNFTKKDKPAENRIFIEFNSSFGAGLSNYSQIKKIKSRYQSLQERMTDEKNKVAQQIELDWMSSVSLKKQKALLESSLVDTKKVQKSYYRQFLAGRKTWQEVMNSIREVSQLESQLAGVYGEMIVVNWRIFVLIEGVGAVVTPLNQNLAFNQADKILWYSIINPKQQQSSIDKMLNFVIPNEKPVEKITQKENISTKQVQNKKPSKAHTKTN
jgi:adhesin transport system outer membrane protein